MKLRFTFYRDDACILGGDGTPHAITQTTFAFLSTVAQKARIARSGGAWIGVLEFDELAAEEVQDILAAPLGEDLMQQLESLVPPP